jgi:predicted nucleic acid-binding Zn finger protein
MAELKFTRMKSRKGRRRFVIIENFTWCQSIYFQLFRGFQYQCKVVGHAATISRLDNMRIRYKDKHEILFKPGKRTIDLKERL